MVTSGFAFFLLSACYYLIDVKKWWSGKPVLFAGMNAILLYVGELQILCRRRLSGLFVITNHSAESAGVKILEEIVTLIITCKKVYRFY